MRVGRDAKEHHSGPQIGFVGEVGVRLGSQSKLPKLSSPVFAMLSHGKQLSPTAQVGATSMARGHTPTAQVGAKAMARGHTSRSTSATAVGDKDPASYLNDLSLACVIAACPHDINLPTYSPTYLHPPTCIHIPTHLPTHTYPPSSHTRNRPCHRV